MIEVNIVSFLIGIALGGFISLIIIVSKTQDAFKGKE